MLAGQRSDQSREYAEYQPAEKRYPGKRKNNTDRNDRKRTQLHKPAALETLGILAHDT